MVVVVVVIIVVVPEVSITVLVVLLKFSWSTKEQLITQTCQTHIYSAVFRSTCLALLSALFAFTLVVVVYPLVAGISGEHGVSCL